MSSVTIIVARLKPAALVFGAKFLGKPTIADPGVYRFQGGEVNDGYVIGYNHHLHPTEPVYVFLQHCEILDEYPECFPMPPTCKDHKPLRCLNDFGWRAEVAEARRRVKLKRFLYKRGLEIDINTPTPQLRQLVRMIHKSGCAERQHAEPEPTPAVEVPAKPDRFTKRMIEVARRKKAIQLTPQTRSANARALWYWRRHDRKFALEYHFGIIDTRK